jgi:hypothetical protein
MAKNSIGIKCYIVYIYVCRQYMKNKTHSSDSFIKDKIPSTPFQGVQVSTAFAFSYDLEDKNQSALCTKFLHYFKKWYLLVPVE